MKRKIAPMHLNAKASDFRGNHGINRYVFLTGCDERAEHITQQFSNSKVIRHARANVYLGDLSLGKHKIAVASVATGMGCPSLDIIVNELILLGAKRFLRIGTAGSLQPDQVKVGDLVIPSAAVRDEDTSKCYLPAEFPATASLAMISAAIKTSHQLALHPFTHVGVVHTKSSFYAREIHQSLFPENKTYMDTMRKASVLATEMECAQLFILATLFKQQDLKNDILAGAILGIVGDKEPYSRNQEKIALAIDRSIALGIRTILNLAKEELSFD